MNLLASCQSLLSSRAIVCAMLLILPLPVWATLGDNASSVLTDQAQMKGALNSTDKSTYVVHEITLTSGTKVREFATPGGAIFAVAWQGQYMPNLQQLLGPYYQQVVQARQAAQPQPAQDGSSAPTIRARRAPVVVQTSGLVVVQAGHQRDWHGLAYIPQLVPQGVPVSEIH